MKAKHTPVKLLTGWYEGESYLKIVSEDKTRRNFILVGGPIHSKNTNESTSEFAEFIVRACNCHDELLAACEAIAKLNEGQGRRNMCEIAGQAQQAIAKATGEI